MPIANIEKRLKALQELFERLSFAYRRGDFEQAVHLTTKSGPRPLSILGIDTSSPTPFRNAAAKLFEMAQELQTLYKSDRDIPAELKEQVAEHVLLAQTLSYEIMDYFLMKDQDVSEHFLKMAREVSKDVEGYYHKNYDFVVTPRAREVIVKQLILGALSGVNVHYRNYAAPGHSSVMTQLGAVIEFLEERFARFCGRDYTTSGLLGLAYFLKGRLLLGRSQYEEADDCFRRSADNYVRKLTHGEASPASRGAAADEEEEAVRVSVGELLALRRAALVLAFGRGYSALINSRIKEAVSFLILARGVLHFNSPSVYSSYTQLLYWAAKRAESSHDPATLEEAKRGIEECRRVFDKQVPNSHYPHRAGIEQSLVLHYLAQHQPERRTEYYREAVEKLSDAVKFARGDGVSRKPNVQLYAEACYILSHILRYQSADLTPPDSERSVHALSEAFRYAKEAESESKHFPRHRCEALLALCGVYAEIDRRGIKLSEVDPDAKPSDTPLNCGRNSARKALQLNDGANHRVSGICHLRLVDIYLKNPHTYSMALDHWREWENVKDSIEHAFVKDWATRIEAELNMVKERNLIIDLGGGQSIAAMRDNLNASFAKRKIIEWVKDSHHLYERTNKEPPEDIIRRREPGKPGRPNTLKKDLEDYLLKELNVRKKSEVSKLIKDHDLLKLATDLMTSYLA